MSATRRADEAAGVPPNPGAASEKPVASGSAANPISDHAARPGRAALHKVRLHAQSILDEVGLSDPGAKLDDEALLKEMLSKFEDLDKDLQAELIALKDVLAGDMAAEIDRKISSDGQLRLTVSEDQMMVFLAVTPPTGAGKPVSRTQVQAELQKLRIRAPVDEQALQRALDQAFRERVPVEKVCICRGQAPRRGEDGKVELLFDTLGQAEEPEGQARGLSVQMVKAGQVLARLHPPSPGKAGFDVFGQLLPPEPGKPCLLEAGENVTCHPDQGAYLAAVDGVPELVGRVLHVHNHWVIDGDVDVATGNVEFAGAVTIRGSVRDGLSVHARDDIRIDGMIEAAEVISSQGSVGVRQGINGRGRGFVSAARDIEAQFAENAHLYAGRDIRLEASVRSDLFAGHTIQVMRGRGTIIAGSVTARHLVDVKVLGSPSNVPTEVTLGLSAEDQQVLREMDRSLASLRQSREKLQQALRQFEKLSPDPEKLSPVERDLYARLKKASVLVGYQLRRCEKERADRLQQQYLHNDGLARVRQSLMPGVRFRIGEKTLRIDVEKRACAVTYDLQTSQIVCTDYQ